jgi:hypothetical protein
MLFAIVRLIGVLWILGFIAFALAATSSYLFSSDPERARRYSGRLSGALLWPSAILSTAGRARLRRGF